MGRYCAAMWKLEDKFKGLEFNHVERDRNATVDAVSKLRSTRAQVPPRIFVLEIQQPSIVTDQKEECNSLCLLEADPIEWRELIIRYIRNEQKPDDKGHNRVHCKTVGPLYHHRGPAIQKRCRRGPHEVHPLGSVVSMLHQEL